MALSRELKAAIEMALCDLLTAQELETFLDKLATIYAADPSYALYTKFASSDAGGVIPTAAALVAAFGACSVVGIGFLGIYKNTNVGDGKSYFVTTDGTDYYYATVTAAV